MKIEDGRLIYHLTPISSLESIIKHGLMSRASLKSMGIKYVDTADHEILDERERLGLSHFIPFHFHIHTAYDTAVKNNHSDKMFSYICLNRSYAKSNGFLVLPFHPASNERPQLFDYAVGFNRIDWKTMEMTNSEAAQAHIDSRYHRQVRMAECLSRSIIPATSFQSIKVPDSNAQKYVSGLLDTYLGCNEHRPFVDIADLF